MNNVLKFSALAFAAVLATGCSNSMTKESEARLTATEDSAARAQARADEADVAAGRRTPGAARAAHDAEPHGVEAVKQLAPPSPRS